MDLLNQAPLSQLLITMQLIGWADSAGCPMVQQAEAPRD